MKALEEMVRQVGMPEFDERGMMKKGVIVRHLLLPGHVRNSKKVLEYDRLLDHAISLGVTNCFIQEGETAKESFIPEFNGEGV